MLFVGEYRPVLDAKNRLSIPAIYRKKLGASFYITRKMDKCLAIYTEEEWEKLTDKLNAQPDSVVGDIKQFIYSQTVIATPDSQGRIVLTNELMQYAEIRKNTVVVGVGTYLQIWSDELYEAKQKSLDPNALKAQMLQLGL